MILDNFKEGLNYNFPLSALLEYFQPIESEMLLEKRLNSSSYLKFKEDKKNKGVEKMFLNNAKKDMKIEPEKDLVEKAVTSLLRLSQQKF